MRAQPLQTKALLLRLTPLGESDVLVDLFTSDLGRATALAKGGKRSLKRFCGLLLTGQLLEVNLVPTKSGDLWRLEAASLLAPHLGLRTHWQRWLMAGPVLELLLRATAHHDPHPGALELALAALARLARATTVTDMASALVIFLVRLLGELGYGLNLSQCLHCGRPLPEIGQPRLSLGGGVVCELCPPGQREHPVPPGLVKALEAATTFKPAALGRLRFAPQLLGPALAFLGDFWTEITERDLPSLGLVKELPALPRTQAGQANRRRAN